jgi:SAM-dependent methyltransferase
VGERDWAAIFDREFAAPASGVAARVWRAVFADEYPAGLDPYSFVSRTELATICEVVDAVGAEHLVDVGCGRGGPGLWVAQQSGARLTGVDIAPQAVQEATARARALGMAERAQFIVGSFADLPLTAGEADVIMSVDAMLFAPDKRAAIHELGRVVRVRGMLVFTSWTTGGSPGAARRRSTTTVPCWKRPASSCTATTRRISGDNARSAPPKGYWPRSKNSPPRRVTIRMKCAPTWRRWPPPATT